MMIKHSAKAIIKEFSATIAVYFFWRHTVSEKQLLKKGLYLAGDVSFRLNWPSPFPGCGFINK